MQKKPQNGKSVCIYAKMSNYFQEEMKKCPILYWGLADPRILIADFMFKRILKWFKGDEDITSATNLDDKSSPRVKGTYSFLGLKIELENPNGKTILFAVLFLIVVLVIIFYLHRYIPLAYRMIS